MGERLGVRNRRWKIHLLCLPGVHLQHHSGGCCTFHPHLECIPGRKGRCSHISPTRSVLHAVSPSGLTEYDHNDVARRISEEQQHGRVDGGRLREPSATRRSECFRISRPTEEPFSSKVRTVRVPDSTAEQWMPEAIPSDPFLTSTPVRDLIDMRDRENPVVNAILSPADKILSDGLGHVYGRDLGARPGSWHFVNTVDDRNTSEAILVRQTQRQPLTDAMKEAQT